MHGSRKIVFLKAGVFVRTLYVLGIPKIKKNPNTVVIIIGFFFFFMNGKTFLGDLHEFTNLSSS